MLKIVDKRKTWGPQEIYVCDIPYGTLFTGKIHGLIRIGLGLLHYDGIVDLEDTTRTWSRDSCERTMVINNYVELSGTLEVTEK